MKPLIVLFVSHSSDMYGAEQSLLSLVTNLKQRKKIIPIVLLPCKGRLQIELQKAGVETITHSYANWIGPKSILDRYVLKPLRLIKILPSLLVVIPRVKSIKPDLIYSNTIASPLGAFIAILTKTPHIWHARENVQEGLNCDFDFGEKLSMKVIKKSSSVICNSVAVKKNLAKLINKDYFKVVYNGFSFDTIWNKKPVSKTNVHNDSNKPVKIAIVGNIHPAKGHEDAVKALAELISMGFNFQLSIVGEGNRFYIKALKELSISLFVADKITWHGYVNKPLMNLKDISMVLICSRNESFGRTAVESIAAGIPVVGTSSGGLPEIISDGETGLLYNPGDYKHLAFQIKALITDRKLYEKCITTGQQKIKERFSMQQYVEQIESIICETCSYK